MIYNNLKVEEGDKVLVLTVNREKSMNAINSATMEELRHFFGEYAPKRKDVHGIIVTGAGSKAFIAGADIKEFLEMDAETGRRMAKKGQDVFFFIERSAVPVIAAVNGFALGAGCELAMACHLRIAGEHARFGQPEVNLGLIPGYGGTQRLVQLIGKTKAMELLLTGDMIDAAEAHRLGLVNHVVPSGEEVAKSGELLKKIGSKGPLAVANVIKAVNAFFQYNEDGFDTELRAFGASTGTGDFREGAQAFIEKRPPAFKGK